jgi:two-component system, chemotaxis family, protein-glutamate methylesterase/glutaminase
LLFGASLVHSTSSGSDRQIGYVVLHSFGQVEPKMVRAQLYIGGSLGGLQALERVVRAFPPAFPATVAAVLHTGERSPRLLAKPLAQHTPLHVDYAEDGQHPLPRHIYLAPPAVHLVVLASGSFGLEAGPKVRYSRPAADRLFTTAAQAFGERVIGVVPSGGGADGTGGLASIKSRGGMTIVQSPSDAQDSGMPRSALMGCSSDYVQTLDRRNADRRSGARTQTEDVWKFMRTPACQATAAGGREAHGPACYNPPLACAGNAESHGGTSDKSHPRREK